GATLGTGKVAFKLVITTSYVVSRTYYNGVQGAKLDPQYFLPEGAPLAPWRVTVENQGTDGLGAPARENSSDLTTLRVLVRDWQKAVGTSTVVAGFTATTPAQSLLGPSRPKTVSVDIPGITSSVQKIDVLLSSSAGTEFDPVVALAAVINNPSATPGDYVGFVKVQDERSNDAVMDGQALYETAGITKDLLPYNLVTAQTSYATYQLFTYTVADTGAHAVIDSLEASMSGRLVADARGSFFDAPNTAIVTYDWVWDYTNPADFTAPDATTATAIYAGAHTFASAGSHAVGLRVTTDLGDTDIVSLNVVVRGARDPFTTPAVVSVATGITNMKFGTSSQDFTDSITADPLGGETLLAIGSHLYLVWYGKPGASVEGLYISRSLDSGSSWAAPQLLLDKANPAFTQYGGASIAGGLTAGGNDHVYVALGTVAFVPAGTGRILGFENVDAGTANPWVQTTIDTYTMLPGATAACSPALAVNPLNNNEVHLVYGTDTNGASNGVARKWRIRSSTTAVAGLAADVPWIINAAGGPDSAWLTDASSGWALDIAQSRISEQIYLMIGMNQTTYVTRSNDHGASWTQALSS
ncbi:MAG: hypothetical protein ABI743_14620, partial [bacterium]